MDKPDNRIRELEIGGIRYLGLRLAHGRVAPSTIHDFHHISETGLVVGNCVEKWDPVGFSMVDGDLYIYGAPFNSLPKPFLHLLDASPLLNIPPQIILFVQSLRLLLSEGIVLKKLYPEGVFFLEDGRILLLPEAVMQKALGLQPIEARHSGFDSLNHPDLTGEENASFFLGSLLYRMCTGSFPQGTRTLSPLPPSLARPDLKEEISSFILEVLTSASKPSLLQWESKLQSYSTVPLVAPLAPQDIKRKTEEANRFQKERDRIHRRRAFWLHNRGKILSVALAACFAGYLAYVKVSNLAKPPSTLGLTPGQVVRLFYSSMNTLDYQAMKDSVKGQVGRPYIDGTMKLHVISRMRLAMESTTGMIDADTWYGKGRPPIPEGRTLYGIGNLSIQRGGKEAQVRAQYTVQFDRWMPRPYPSPEERFQGFRIEERVSLQKEGSRWLIIDISRTSVEPLSLPYN